MFIRAIIGRHLLRMKEKFKIPDFVTELIDSIRCALKSSNFCALSRALPSMFGSNTTENEESEKKTTSNVNEFRIWIPFHDFWTTLAMKSGVYLRRFSWKSGLGMAIALYLTVSFVFCWIPSDDEGDAFNDNIHFGLRALLSATSAYSYYSYTFMIIRSKTNPDLIFVEVHRNNSGRDAYRLPLSDQGNFRCNEAMDKFLNGPLPVSYANDEARRSRTVSASYWLLPMEDNAHYFYEEGHARGAYLLQICMMDSDIIVESSSWKMVSSSGNVKDWAAPSQKVLNSVLPDPKRVDSVNRAGYESAMVTYLVINSVGTNSGPNELVLVKREFYAHLEIPFLAQVGRADCEEALQVFMDHWGVTYLNPDKKGMEIKNDTDWIGGDGLKYQLCHIRADIQMPPKMIEETGKKPVKNPKFSNIKKVNMEDVRAESSMDLYASDKAILNAVYGAPIRGIFDDEPRPQPSKQTSDSRPPKRKKQKSNPPPIEQKSNRPPIQQKSNPPPTQSIDKKSDQRPRPQSGSNQQNGDREQQNAPSSQTSNTVYDAPNRGASDDAPRPQPFERESHQPPSRRIGQRQGQRPQPQPKPKPSSAAKQKGNSVDGKSSKSRMKKIALIVGIVALGAMVCCCGAMLVMIGVYYYM